MLDINLGFTGGNNAILRTAMQSADPPQYFLLLNSDTIVRPNAFKALVDFMDQNPKIGIAGSRLEEPDGTPQRSALRFQSPLGEFEGNLALRGKKWVNGWARCRSRPSLSGFFEVSGGLKTCHVFGHDSTT